MARKWNASDFPPIEHVRPRIVLHLRRFGPLTYRWKCTHKDSGSGGYGFSPEHAYAEWRRNYERRARLYREREGQARRVIAWHEAKRRAGHDRK